MFEFLADLRNHWRLEERAFVSVEALDERSGVIRLNGPVGLSRRVRTEVLEARPTTRVAGRARLRGGTVGLVSWDIRPDREGSRVRLTATVPEASWPDRLLLELGGRAWLAALFRRTLANLDAAL